MDKGIELHPTLGVNPRMTFCPRCGGDGPELVLVGRDNAKYTCPECGAVHLGRPDNVPEQLYRGCQKCGSRYDRGWERRELSEFEKLPGSLCADCEKEIEEHQELVAQGGVYWRCAECGKQGVIRAGDYASAVRESAKIAAPDPVGVEFERCSEHEANA